MQNSDLDTAIPLVDYAYMMYGVKRAVHPDRLAMELTKRHLCIVGQSGTGKTSAVRSVADIMNADMDAANMPYKYKAFELAGNGQNRYSAEIPTTKNYKVPQAWLDVFEWLAASPYNIAIFIMDEVLSCEAGFQTVAQKIVDTGQLGHLKLSPDQLKRFIVIATGNTVGDGNKRAQSDVFFCNRFNWMRLSPTTGEALNALVYTGIVPLHPLVAQYLASDECASVWLKQFGPHHIDMRTLEALSQRIEAMADPLTGLLPITEAGGSDNPSDDELLAWQYHRLEMEGLVPAPVVTSIVSMNEKLGHLTSIADIAEDPHNAALPDTGVLGEIMQIMLMESYLFSSAAKANGIQRGIYDVIPHFAVYIDRMSNVCKPVAAKMTAKLKDMFESVNRGGQHDNDPAITARVEAYVRWVDMWRSSMLAVTLSAGLKGMSTGLNLDDINKAHGKKAADSLKKLSAAATGNPLAAIAKREGDLTRRMRDQLINTATADTPPPVPKTQTQTHQGNSLDGIDLDFDNMGPVDVTFDDDDDNDDTGNDPATTIDNDDDDWGDFE